MQDVQLCGMGHVESHRSFNRDIKLKHRYDNVVHATQTVFFSPSQMADGPRLI